MEVDSEDSLQALETVSGSASLPLGGIVEA
jgi:hypothetical protein